MSTKTMRGQNTYTRRTMADIKFHAARMPHSLKGEARKFWKECAPELERGGLLDALSQFLFIPMCHLWESMTLARQSIERRGATLKTARGRIVPNPAVKSYHSSARQFVLFADKLGFGAPARRRLPAPGDVPVDELGEFLARKESVN